MTDVLIGILGIIGPILCLIIVNVIFTAVRFVYLQCKAYRFRKRILRMRSESDNIEDIEGDVFGTMDIRKDDKQNE